MSSRSKLPADIDVTSCRQRVETPIQSCELLDGILYRLATACGTVGWKLPESYTPIPPEFTLGNWTLVEGWERFIELTLGLTGSKKIIGVIGVSRCDLRCVHSTNLIPSHTYTK